MIYFSLARIISFRFGIEDPCGNPIQDLLECLQDTGIFLHFLVYCTLHTQCIPQVLHVVGSIKGNKVSIQLGHLIESTESSIYSLFIAYLIYRMKSYRPLLEYTISGQFYVHYCTHLYKDNQLTKLSNLIQCISNLH